MTSSELEFLINGGNIEECIVAFLGMPESERTKLGRTAVARLRALGKGIPPRLAQFIDTDTVNQFLSLLSIDAPRVARYCAARAAVLSTATFSQWKGVKGHGLPSNEAALRILSDRRPEWLPELVELVCDEEEALNARWDLIRRLVREGYCRAPESPRYIHRMIEGVQSEAASKNTPLARVLLDDPGLLDHEIWRIFDTEPGPRTIHLLAARTEGYPAEYTWEGALAQLAGEGKISRDRLLDGALDGLSRDMHDMRARWFVALHDRLEPTLDERAARSARYVDFLGSRNPSTVDFALKVIKELLKAGRLDPGGVVDRLAPAFHARTKGTLKQALSVLDLAVRNSGEHALKTRAVLVAAEGLVHEATDVQAAILDFIERHGTTGEKPLHDLLAARLDAIAGSLRSRLEAWLELDKVQTRESTLDDREELFARARALDERLACLAGIPEALAALRGERSDLPALTFDGTEIPRLDPNRRLEPIDDLDTLIELCSRLVENPARTEDVDRCVDAISRLCDRRPIDFYKRTAPLETRLRQRLAEQHGMSNYALRSFAVVARSWLTGEVPSPPPFDRSWALNAFISAFVFGLARRVARAEAAPLLSAPTHSGGWIEPRELVVRYRERCSLPIASEPADLILALLRLAPDNRSAALADAGALEGERGAAIRHALGAEGAQIGRTAALWVAAARARSPWADDAAVEARHPRLGPDAGRAAVYHIDSKRMIRRANHDAYIGIDRAPAVPLGTSWMPELPTVSFHCVRWFFIASWPSVGSLWPIALESFFAAGAHQLVEASEAATDWQGMRGFLVPLLDGDVPMRPMARLVLAVGLSVKQAEISGLATDVLVAAIDDGRVDGENLGGSLAIAWQLRIRTSMMPHLLNATVPMEPLSDPFVKPPRWAKALGDAARSSPLHAGVIARALEHVLADETFQNRSTASVLPLFELMREACVQSGRANSESFRAHLGGLASGGKTGRVIAELLALVEVPDAPARKKARTMALASRVARAERWMAWERWPGDSIKMPGGS